jgi:transposase
MQVLYPRCAGLDVHKATVVACVRLVVDGVVTTEVRTFPTTTAGLCALAVWLVESGVTHVAMEATGIYWKPVWHILSDYPLEVILANAAHVKNVPGRKTDVADATWLAELLAHGLIRASFVPPRPVAELRTLLRTRKQLVREHASHIQRAQKTLEDANIKLDSAISDIMGKSGRAMIEAMIAGETDPNKLADLADRRIQAPRAVLVEALTGRIKAQHRFLLRLHLRQIDALGGAVDEIDGEIEAHLGPFREAVKLLDTIDGVDVLAAEVIISEIGLDMGRFPSEGHLLSWACMCPRNDESAGKRRSNRVRKGARWLKTTLLQCAWAAARKKGRYLSALYHRLRGRRGSKKAILAVAAAILTAAYHMLKTGTPYRDLGPHHFEPSKKSALTRHLLKRLEGLGYTVDIKPLATPQPASVSL